MAKPTAQARRIDIERQQDIWFCVGEGARLARELGMTETDRVRVETAISELAHNVLLHGGGGTITVSLVDRESKYGVRVCARDCGPGIPDVSKALEDGFTTGNSLGIGLGIAKRMMDDVAIRSHPGWGTIITVTKWADSEC
jgi:serine/threonine-protein kinase RsbT